MTTNTPIPRLMVCRGKKDSPGPLGWDRSTTVTFGSEHNKALAGLMFSTESEACRFIDARPGEDWHIRRLEFVELAELLESPENLDRLDYIMLDHPNDDADLKKKVRFLFEPRSAIKVIRENKTGRKHLCVDDLRIDI